MKFAPQLESKRIFILDDNVANRAIMQFILERAGATIAIDRWGIETVDRLKQFHPVDLILLDLMLPDEINGMYVFRALRKENQFDDVPVIAVSATTPESVIPKLRSLGFNGFIAKPIKQSKFVDQILKVMAGEKVWDFA